MVELLIEYGADVNIMNKLGQTPINCAMYYEMSGLQTSNFYKNSITDLMSAADKIIERRLMEKKKEKTEAFY